MTDEQCPHILPDPDHIDLCKLNNLVVCMLETSVSQGICTEWESIKAEQEEASDIR